MNAPNFDPVEFYELARALADQGQPESARRTAMSRAYYACFHLARLGCWRKWSWLPPDSGQHRAVIRKLREQRQHYLRSQLERLLLLREMADYDLESAVTDVHCRDAMAIASDLIPRLRSL